MYVCSVHAIHSVDVYVYANAVTRMSMVNVRGNVFMHMNVSMNTFMCIDITCIL
jgi:hypothetical protein